MLFRVKLDIDELVKVMLDQLPQDILIHERVIDMSMGGGQFLREVERRKREAGLTTKQIRDTVTGIASDEMDLSYIRRTYNLAGTYIHGNALEMEWKDRMFDVVIGNPPYNNEAALLPGRHIKDMNIGKQFALLALKLSKKYTSLILPYGNRVYSPGTAEMFRKAGLYKIVPTNFKNIEIFIGTYYFDHSKIVDVVDDGFLTGMEIPKDNVITRYDYHVYVGNLSRKDFEHNLKDNGKYQIIVTTKKIGYTDDSEFVEKLGDHTHGHWRVIVNGNNGGGKLGRVIIAEPKAYLSRSVSAFIVKNKTEALRLKKHLEQPFVNELMAKIKVSSSNARKYLQYIPSP